MTRLSLRMRVLGASIAVCVLGYLLAAEPWQTRISGTVPTQKQTMSGVVYTAHGDVAKVLQYRTDLPLPSFGEREVLIEVHAAGINPVDYKMVEGQLEMVEPLLGMSSHTVPGFDVAGRVVAVGRKCDRIRVGDEVFLMNDFRWRGGLAEYVTAVEHRVVVKPSYLTMAEAAALPMVALTSYQALHTIAAVKAGQRVLVLAGSGGTGQAAIQIAKHLGAYVATTCSEANFELVQSLGADQVIDYRSTNFSDVLEANSFDVVYDCVGGRGNWDMGELVLRKSGHYVTIVGDTAAAGLSLQGIALKVAQSATRKLAALVGRGPRYDSFVCIGSGAALAVLGDWAAKGVLRAKIDKILSLEQFALGFAHQKSGRATGKVVFEVKPQAVNGDGD